MKKRLSLLLILIGVSSCMQPVMLPEIHRYQLTANMACFLAAQTCNTLYISLPYAIAPYDTVKMHYSVCPNEMRQFAENQWVAPPAQMILPLIERSIRVSHRFKAVTAFPAVANADYRLDTSLLLLQQEFRGSRSYVHIILDATFVATKTQAILATKRFDVCVPTLCNTPVSGVAAYQAALSKILLQLTSFVLASSC